MALMWELVALRSFLDKTEDAHVEHELHGPPLEKELSSS